MLDSLYHGKIGLLLSQSLYARKEAEKTARTDRERG
jgi:hypothetical protein